MEERKSFNGGLKAFGVILTILALIAGMAAIVRPIQQQIDSLQSQVRDHRNLNNHPYGVLAEVAKIHEKFTEVETQFKGQREVIEMKNIRNTARIDKLEEWQKWWYRDVWERKNIRD